MRDAKGRFLPGPDPDRHALSQAERRKGFWVATGYWFEGRPVTKMPSRTRAWLRNKIKAYYRGRPRRAVSA